MADTPLINSPPSYSFIQPELAMSNKPREAVYKPMPMVGEERDTRTPHSGLVFVTPLACPGSIWFPVLCLLLRTVMALSCESESERESQSLVDGVSIGL